MYNDTLSDFIVRLRNSTAAEKKTVRVRPSKTVERVAEILRQEGYISSISTDNRVMEIVLNPAMKLSHIKSLSRPSLRRYVGYKEIPQPRSGFSTVILSTPKGILTGAQAHKQKVGGELICELW